MHAYEAHALRMHAYERHIHERHVYERHAMIIEPFDRLWWTIYCTRVVLRICGFEI